MITSRRGRRRGEEADDKEGRMKGRRGKVISMDVPRRSISDR